MAAFASPARVHAHGVAKRLAVLGAFTAVIAVHGIAQPTDAHAAARHIRGVCGIHRGAIVIPYNHRYHVRIGVKRGHVGGSHRCRGLWHRRSGLAQWGITTGGGLPWWSPFDFGRWNWRGIVDVGTATAFTAASCAGFAAAFAGEFPTSGLDTAITAAAGAGCVNGAKLIQGAVNRDFPTRG
jgi:hypothetical protein